MRSEREIHDEIKACLKRSMADDMSPACLADCTAKLREQGWAWSDIRRIQMAVMQVLTNARCAVGNERSWPSNCQGERFASSRTGCL